MSASLIELAPRVDPLIRLDDVWRSFVLPGRTAERFDAVKGVSLQVQRGDAFGLVGTSGAGKSTLLRLINLLERPDRGRVIVDGRNMIELGRRELGAARADIGMVFQQFNLLQNASVFDNVAFPLRLRGRRSAAEIESRVMDCLGIVGIVEKARAYPVHLSGGQKQRVAIARALAPRPSVLLCDEPTSALDSETTRALLATLREINVNLGVTLVVVTHQLDVVRDLCSRVGVMEHGELIEQFALAETGISRLTRIGRSLASRSCDEFGDRDREALHA